MADMTSTASNMDIPAAQAALRKVIAIHTKHMALPTGVAPSPASVRAEMDLIETAAAALAVTTRMPGKAFAELKAESMTTSRLDQWLRGGISRRVLVLPFGGPIPSKASPLGVDLDGEWFDAATDIYGPYKALQTSRERLVDWHHGNDPTGRMKGAILGRVILDEHPQDDGYWAEMWANAGETRRKLIADLERRGVPLYGSSEAVPGSTRKTDGHIDVWPIIRHTITTSPQNTWAVVPSLKALLTADDLPFDEIGYAALKAAMLGLADTLTDLRPTFSPEAADTFLGTSGDDAAKAGRVLSSRNEAELQAALGVLMDIIGRMRGTTVEEQGNA